MKNSYISILIIEYLASDWKSDATVTVHLLSMLDYPNQDKRTPSILDIAFEHKYQNTNVTFQSVDSLR